MLQRSPQRARKSTTSAGGTGASAAQIVHAGRDPPSPAGASPASSPTRCPIATPNPIDTRIVRAPTSRAVPETRLRVDSSVTAIVSVSPGTRKITPPRITVSTPSGVTDPSAIASSATTIPATNSSTRAYSRRRRARSHSTPTSTPSPAAEPISASPPPKNRAADPDSTAKQRMGTTAGYGSGEVTIARIRSIPSRTVHRSSQTSLSTRSRSTRCWRLTSLDFTSSSVVCGPWSPS